MPTYTVPIPGGGEYHVNASSQQAAYENVGMQAPSGGGGGGTSAPASSGGGTSGSYNTVNGIQTAASMEQQLRAAGWGGGEDVATAYARTTGGPVTAASGGGAPAAPSPAGTPPANQTGANIQAGQLLLQQAQQAAYQAYLNAKLALDTDQEAYQKAAQAAATEIAQAGVTGTYQGQQTQAAIRQAADIAQQQAATMLSQANAFGTWGTPTQGQQTLAANQQAYQQQLDAQKQALAQWQAQQTASQNYLTMMAGLRGPADYAQYQKVLGSTPGGLKDLAAAAAGQYIPGGGATTGVQPQAVTMQSFLGSATGQQPATSDTSGQAAMNSLVAPNQMAPQTWNALTPSQQQMLLGTWESQGYTKDDAQALFNQSLPKYATQSVGAGQFKLQ
jgi:hypothetical protein